MYRFEEIRTVHLEISTLCNARCPMCLRNVQGGKTNPMLPLKDLRIEQIREIFKPNFLKQLKRIYLCGNYGDPIMARDTLAAFAFFRAENPQLRLEMMTNGSAREEEWWQEFARLGVAVHFGVDGADQTSAIYRRGTDFETVMRNARAFIEAGGVAHWDYLVFRHNEHQVEAARELSRKMGFASFRTKRTARFFSNQKSAFKDRQEVIGESGEVEYYLEKPLSSEFLNPSLERERVLTEKYGSFERYLECTAVDCKVASEKSLYVSAEGFVFPCCWTAIQLYPWYSGAQKTEIWSAIREAGGIENLSALSQPIERVVEGSFFQKILPGRWRKDSFAAGKLKVCSRICGAEFDPFRDQFRSAN